MRRTLIKHISLLHKIVSSSPKQPKLARRVAVWWQRVCAVAKAKKTFRCAQLPLRPRVCSVPFGDVMRGYACAVPLGMVGTSA